MLEVCAEAVPHIVRQRTELAGGNVIREYRKDVAADVEQIRPYLPDEVHTIVGIGCGMAGTEIELAKLYDPKPSLCMMDGDGSGEIQAGYHEHVLVPWNDTGIAKAQANINGVTAHVIKPDPEMTLNCDLIVSLLSWCHHYPAEHYLGLAMRSLRKGGRLVVDCRKNTANLATLTRHFHLIHSMEMRGINGRKSRRVVLEAW